MKNFVIFDAFLIEYDIYLKFLMKNIRNNSFLIPLSRTKHCNDECESALTSSYSPCKAGIKNSPIGAIGFSI